MFLVCTKVAFWRPQASKGVRPLRPFVHCLAVPALHAIKTMPVAVSTVMIWWIEAESKSLPWPSGNSFDVWWAGKGNRLVGDLSKTPLTLLVVFQMRMLTANVISAACRSVFTLESPLRSYACESFCPSSFPYTTKRFHSGLLFNAFLCLLFSCNKSCSNRKHRRKSSRAHSQAVSRMTWA